MKIYNKTDMNTANCHMSNANDAGTGKTLSQTLRFVACGALALLATACVTGPSSDKPDFSGLTEVQESFETGKYQIKRKQWADAEATLVGMTQKYPDLSGPYMNLALVYLKTDRYPQALSAVDGAIELNPGKAEAYNLRGVILRNMQRYSAAAQAYQDALQINPEYAFAHLNLAILYDEYLKQPAQAVQSYYLYRETSDKLSEGERAQLVYWLKLLDMNTAAAGS